MRPDLAQALAHTLRRESSGGHGWRTGAPLAGGAWRRCKEHGAVLGCGGHMQPNLAQAVGRTLRRESSGGHGWRTGAPLAGGAWRRCKEHGAVLGCGGHMQPNLAQAAGRTLRRESSGGHGWQTGAPLAGEAWWRSRCAGRAAAARRRCSRPTTCRWRWCSRLGTSPPARAQMKVTARTSHHPLFMPQTSRGMSAGHQAGAEDPITYDPARGLSRQHALRLPEGGVRLFAPEEAGAVGMCTRSWENGMLAGSHQSTVGQHMKHTSGAL